MKLSEGIKNTAGALTLAAATIGLSAKQSEAAIVKQNEFHLVTDGNPLDPWANGHVSMTGVMRDNLPVIRYIGNDETVSNVNFNFMMDTGAGLPGTVKAYFVSDPANLITSNLSSNPSVALSGSVATDLLMPGDAQVYSFTSNNVFPASFKASTGDTAAIVFEYLPAADETMILMTTRQNFGTQPVDYNLTPAGLSNIDMASEFSAYGAVEISTVPEPALALLASVSVLALARRNR